MTNSTLEAVLRRDRLVVAGAVGVVVALAWGYVLWLAADMDMGGMDMAGFRMIPAGIGIMAPPTRRGEQSSSGSCSPCGR
jgi:predicted metal-binding membrane protein